MIGALAGDIIGSIYEFSNHKGLDIELISDESFFTDDSVLTVALADSILYGKPYVKLLKTYYNEYPGAGYGGMFHRWASSGQSKPYNSFGNGAAMRISPVGFAFHTLEEVLQKAEEYSAVTHNHSEGIRGAQAVAASIFWARTGFTRDQIRAGVQERFGYHLGRTCDEIRPGYHFDETCQGSVPEAMTAFLESNSFEHAIRLAVSLGGDSDTIACITGGIAQAFYGGVPVEIEALVWDKLSEGMGDITRAFRRRYHC